MQRLAVSLLAVATVLPGSIAAGCASAPPRAVQPAAPEPAPTTIDQKVAWILRLEQQRILRDETAAPAGAPAPAPAAARATTPTAAPAMPFVPASSPDLAALLRDPSEAIRARAALAVGRVGDADGVALLARALSDPAVDVRASAAFGLGLAGSAEGLAPLQSALGDAEPLVRARAIEALGLLGNAAASSAISQAADGCGPLIAPIEPDDQEWPKAPAIEICRQALYAFVRLRQYDALARIALDANGAPVSRWWPVAYALGRIADERAAPALRALLSVPAIHTPLFALRGLAALKHADAAPAALALAKRTDADVKLRVAAIRMLGAAGGTAAVAPLLDLAFARSEPVAITIEAIAALGALGAPSAFDALVDLVKDSRPSVRAAALSAAAKADAEGFLLVLSGIGPDRDWTVRAALAPVLGSLPADRVTAAIEELTEDEDARVHGPALEALAAVKAPSAAKRILAALEAPDPVERGTAARLVGELKIEGGVAALTASYTRAAADADFDARAGALEGLAKFGTPESRAVLRQALGDREWPVRLRAAELLRELGETDATPTRPAPLRQPASFFSSAELLHPAYTPHAFIETARGTIEVQLNVVEAAVTTATFIEQARAGLFNGIRVHRVVPAFVVQAGDPRGDGTGGPGYAQPDELSPVPFLRGTMGMALSWRDTAGSQWFITAAPQPHLDAKYTVFGRVVRGGEVIDQIAQWDVIERIRIWDGVAFR
jgi:cyclophilin family peptidyl-prolyl cis-trans isomerase/HEAT repeat protein